eukprot:TRINITY_DN7101_c0_g1_i1.p1 TRINITY_DN7101_c0_g1~~TRINITY_DN7101_c0_g1_i1.p1  ORF type:complete len:460 (+),score=92.02 TRINITY_DN7101_c0_g1_i1:27-1406(+)
MKTVIEEIPRAARRRKIRSMTSPIRPKFLQKEPDLDSPVVKAIDILKRLKPELGGARDDDLDFVISVLTSNQIVKHMPDLDGGENNSEDKIDSDIRSYLLYQSGKEKNTKIDDLLHTLNPAKIVHNLSELENINPEFLDIIDEYLGKCNFPSVEINDITDGNILLYTALAIFNKRDLINRFNIDERLLINFLQNIESGYKVGNNPYHNNMHGAEVLQCLDYLIYTTHLIDYLSDTHELGAILAAIIHDYKHPGYNNHFIVSTGNDIALIYNDKSVLENYHLSQSFQILYECQLLSHLPAQALRSVRKIIIDMVLATDMTQHFDILGQFKTKQAAGVLTPKNNGDPTLLLEIAIKCADLGHTTKMKESHINWTNRINTEFYNQGEEEKGLGLEVSPFMDKEKANIPKSQSGFITYIVLPLFQAFVTQFPKSGQMLVQLRSNLSYWNIRKLEDERNGNKNE